jgi:hypothetical protein
VNPEAEEICGNGVDENCNEDQTECHLSGDFNGDEGHLILVGSVDGDALGSAIAWIGNWDDQDGDDLWIGVPDRDGVKNKIGTAFVFGGNQQGEVAYANTLPGLWGREYKERLESAVLALDDADGDRLAELVASIQDVDEDGLREMLIGCCPTYDGISGANATGAVAVLMSKSWANTNDSEIDLNQSAQVIFVGDDGHSDFGSALDAAGNTNGDEWPELIVGAPKYSSENTTNRGAVFLLELEANLSGEISAYASGQLILGKNGGDRLGSAVAGVGDTNYDGYDDFLVGATGDMNLDGYTDIAMAAPGTDANGASAAGAVYFFLGPLSVNLDVTSADATVYGTIQNQAMGTVLGGPGDYDDDGRPDFAIEALDGGSPADMDSTDRGAVFVFLGTDY